MTDRLMELAREFGVETHSEPRYESYEDGVQLKGPLRPRLDVAHDLLDALDQRSFHCEKFDGQWRAVNYDGPLFRSGIVYRGPSFESAVIALAERARESK